MPLTKVTGGEIDGASSINVTGIVTATSFSGDVSGNINSSGVSTFSTLRVGTGVTISSGVVTATSFVGNLTGNVTGNVTGNATGLSGTPSISVNSITAATATFTGNVSVAGTVTYEDVTNVDSIGIVTARGGLQVGTGGTVITTTTGGLVGIGTINPTSKLQVQNGGILVKGATTPNINFEPAGSLGNADISFDGSTFTLVSNSSSAAMLFNTNSTERVRITSSGDVGIGTGNPQAKLQVNQTSLTAPSITFGASAGQIFRNESAELAFGLGNASPYPLWIQGRYSNNSARDIVLNPLGGNLGIGTNNPTTELEVLGTGTVAFFRGKGGSSFIGIKDEDDGTLGFIGVDGGTLKFQTSGSGYSDKLIIDTSGNIGIGTINPTDKLSIYSAPNSLVLGAKDTTRGNHIFQLLADNVSGDGELRLYKNSASGTHEKTVEIASTGNSYFTGGNIGIGTNNPSGATVDIFAGGTTSAFSLLRISNLADGATAGFLGLQKFGSAATSYGPYSANNVGIDAAFTQFNLGTQTGHPLTLYTNNTERVRIDSSGNLGIGTNNPISYTANSKTLHIHGASNPAELRLTTNSSGVSAATDGAILQLNGTSLSLWNVENSEIRFGTNDTERVRITSGGNIGIGLTNPNTKLDIVCGVGSTGIVVRPSSLSADANGNASAVNNMIHLRMPYGANPGAVANAGAKIGIVMEGRNDETFQTFGGGKRASIYGVSEDDGAGYSRRMGLAFYTSPTDAAEVERIRISNTGNVGIATNNPSYRLHVFGSGNQNAITVSGLQNDTDQALFIPKGAINFDSAGTAHIRNSGTTTSELRLSSRGVTTGITFYHGGTGDVTNSGTLSAGIHQSGGVGKFAVGVAYTTSYPASILAREGVISPLVYWPRDYATASGSIGYDSIAVGGRVNLKPASEPGSLNTFLHGTFDPGYGSGGENQSWNKFRVIFRLTRDSLSYNGDTITMGLQRYFYSVGWTDIPNSTWTFNGTDSERGSRWTASRWVDYGDFSNTSDVPGFAIKYHSSSPSGIANNMRVGAVYIQYAYFS